MYIDLVLCKHSGCSQYYLFKAPAFTHLQKGELVIVDTVRGEQEATVVNSITLDDQSEAAKFICDGLKAKELKKVLKKVAYQELRYREDET